MSSLTIKASIADDQYNSACQAAKEKRDSLIRDARMVYLRICARYDDAQSVKIAAEAKSSPHRIVVPLINPPKTASHWVSMISERPDAYDHAACLNAWGLFLRLKSAAEEEFRRSIEVASNAHYQMMQTKND